MLKQKGQGKVKQVFQRLMEIKDTQVIVQAIIASTGQESISESDSDNDQLDTNLLLGTQIYSVTISEKSAAADFSIKIQGYKIKRFFYMGAQVMRIP